MTAARGRQAKQTTVDAADFLEEEEEPTEQVKGHGPIHVTNEVLVMGKRMPAPTKWQQPQAMPAPDPREGFQQRWVYVGYGSEAQSNLMAKIKAGWRPRAADSAPAEYSTMTGTNSNLAGAIVTGDSCLMEMPTAIYQQMHAHYKEQNARMQRIIDAGQADMDGPGSAPIHIEAIRQVSNAEPTE